MVQSRRSALTPRRGVQMRTLLKALGVLVVILVTLMAGAAAFARFGSDVKMHRKVRIEVAPIASPIDQATLARGAYLYKSRGCGMCHGNAGAGAVVINEGGMFVKAPH